MQNKNEKFGNIKTKQGRNFGLRLNLGKLHKP